MNPNSKRVILSPRLAAVAALVPPCSVCADIGTDHAFVPVYLLQSGICKSAIGGDIHKGPLASAAETAKRYGLGNKITLRLGGGFDSIAPHEWDVAVIAGMGGHMIRDILEKVAEKKPLVLQPMTKISDLRLYLYKNGYKIVKERIAKEGQRLYTILYVEPGQDVPNEFDFYLSASLLEDPLAGEYIEFQMEKTQKTLMRAQGAGKNQEDLVQGLTSQLAYLVKGRQQYENR